MVPSAEEEISDTSGVRDLKLGMLGEWLLRFRVWNLGFGDWVFGLWFRFISA